MAQPPPASKGDSSAGLEKLYSRLPTLIEQARKGTLQPQAIVQLRGLLRDRRPGIEAWYKANNMQFPTLPASVNPLIPTPVNSATNSPRASPGPNPTSGATAAPSSNQTAASAATQTRPPAPRPVAPGQQRPPTTGQTAPQPRPNLQPTAPPLARPPNTSVATPSGQTPGVRPPAAGATNPAARPPGAVRPPTARPPGTGTPNATATSTPSPGAAAVSRTGTPSSTGVPKVTSWTDVFNMTAEQRRSWFDAVPGSEATYNKILEDARKKHMAMRQGDGTGSRQGSPVPSAPGSRGNSPAPTGGPASPAQVNSASGNATNAVRPVNGQAGGNQVRPTGNPSQPTAATVASATRAIRPVNQNMPLPNLAIPAGARRGSSTADTVSTPGSTNTASGTAMPENRPPAGIHSLSQDKIRFYMSLSDAQGQVLPHDQKQLWLWLKKLIQETKQQSASKQAAQSQQRPGGPSVKPGMTGSGQTPGFGGFRMPSVPGGLSMANLNEEISKLYTDGKAPSMQQLRELCMRGGLTWSVQMENLVSPYASDRPKLASGMKLDPIEIPQTPAGGLPIIPKNAKEHFHENVRKVVEYETGGPVDDDLITIFQDLEGDLFQEVLSGGVALTMRRSKEERTLNVRDIAMVSRQAIGVTIPGFGLEQSMIGKRKALPSRIGERHLKKLRAVQRAKDIDVGRIP